MRTLLAGICFATVLAAQTPAPVVNRSGVVRSDSNFPGTLSAGTLFGVYGRYLGPATGCNATADRRGVYPDTLCGVQVLIGQKAVELLYVQDRQINAKVPADSDIREVMSPLTVVFGERSSAPVQVQSAPHPATLSPEGIARVNGPIWVRVQFPQARTGAYPRAVEPWNLGCDSFEVRRAGQNLPQVFHSPAHFGAAPGSECGSLAIPSPSRLHEGALPLHLVYDLNLPGEYELRYTGRANSHRPDAEVRAQSQWTTIQVLAAVPRVIAGHPQDPAELLRDFLPNLLAVRDDETLAILFEYLYHPDLAVRRYAAFALAYWRPEEIEGRLFALLQSMGPTDAVEYRFRGRSRELIDSALVHLEPGSPARLAGALSVLRESLRVPNPALSPELRARVEQALLAAADRTIEMAGRQGAVDFTALLGSVRDERAHELLWKLASNEKVKEQAVTAVAWRKDPADLPRLTEVLLTAGLHEFSALPNVMRSRFGTAALPSLRICMESAASPFMRVNCERELEIAEAR